MSNSLAKILKSGQTENESPFQFNFLNNSNLEQQNNTKKSKKKKKKSKKTSSNGNTTNTKPENDEEDEEEESEEKIESNIMVAELSAEIERIKLDAVTTPHPGKEDPSPQIISTVDAKASKKKKKKSKGKLSNSGTKDQTEADNYDDDMKFLDAIIEQQKEEKKQLARQAKQAPKASKKSALTTTKGPSFVNTKTVLESSSLDQKEKLKLKFGQGKNLVSHGPRKVKDPNWLPPPPGLTKVQANDSSKAGSLSFSNLTQQSDSNQIVYHQSPFTFSFSGL